MYDLCAPGAVQESMPIIGNYMYHILVMAVISSLFPSAALTLNLSMTTLIVESQ